MDKRVRVCTSLLVIVMSRCDCEEALSTVCESVRDKWGGLMVLLGVHGMMAVLNC